MQWRTGLPKTQDEIQQNTRHSALLPWLQLNKPWHWFIAGLPLSILSVDFHPSAYTCWYTSQFPRSLFILRGSLSSSFGKTLISSTTSLLWGWTFHLLWKFLLSRNVTSWPDGKCKECSCLPLHLNYISKKEFRKTDLQNGLQLAPTGSRALSAEKDWKSSNTENQGEPVPPGCSPVVVSLEIGLQFLILPSSSVASGKGSRPSDFDRFWGQVSWWPSQYKEGGNMAIRRENSSSKTRREREWPHSTSDFLVRGINLTGKVSWH